MRFSLFTRFFRSCTTVAALLLSLVCAFAPAAHAAIDFTDIWQAEGGTESGWGVNFAQTGDFIFATFFIYGPTGTPVWYTAQLSRTTGDTFSGAVYAVTGTWFGAPIFVPVPPANAVPVGDATFTATNSHRGTLRYRIDTVNVNKNIERFTTVALSVAGDYLGGIGGTISGTCPSGSAGTFATTMQFRLLQSAANVLRIEFSGADSTNIGQLVCVMQGTATQRGKVLYVPGAAYQCVDGLSTTVEIESVRVLDDGIEAHWLANVGGSCFERGRFTGVKQ
jgi:hypothetical protein